MKETLTLLNEEQKKKIIDKYKLHEKDAGSSEVQVTYLTYKINNLSSHLEKHRKDYHSLRGLMMMINQRKRFLNYIKRKKLDIYKSLIVDLNIRK